MKFILVVKQAYEVEIPDNIPASEILFDHLPDKSTWKEVQKATRSLFEPSQFRMIKW